MHEPELSYLDAFFDKKPSPIKEALLAMRYFVMQPSFELTEHFKYHTAFYYYKNKPFCYFHVDKKTQVPYIGIARGHQMDDPMLVQGNRKKMKVVYLPVNKDLPITALTTIFRKLQALY